MFRLTSVKLSANENEGSILPGSARKVEVLWGNKLPQQNEEDKKLGFFAKARTQLKEFHFGWYTAKISLVWGETNQAALSAYNFFVIPWQLLSIFVFIFLLVVFLGKAGLKRYNKFIINQAKKQQR